MRSLAILFATFAIVGCSTTAVGVKYAPSSTVAKAAPAAQVTVANFVDSRKEPDPRWIGAIRGGFGNPLKTIQTEQPVAVMVRTGFVDALIARDVTVGAAGVKLSGNIVRLECDQCVRREATVEIDMTVQDATGQTKFSRRYSANIVDGSAFALDAGIFGSTELLRALVEKAVRQTIDQTLDDPAMRAALQI